MYDLMPPEEHQVVGVAHQGSAVGGPQPLHSNLTISGDTIIQTDRPAPATADPPAGVLWSVTPDDSNASALKAVQTFAPPAPVAFVSADGSLIFVGASSPSGVVNSSSGGGSGHWLWPTIALIGLVAIIASIAWAYSKRRQNRYLDLKDTEMAMQNRPHNPV